MQKDMEIAPPSRLEKIVHVRVSEGEHRRAEAAARAAGVTVSELVRQATRHATRSVLGADGAREDG